MKCSSEIKIRGIYLLVCYVIASSVAASPLLLEPVTKRKANYLSPENTLASVRSALLEGDLQWADEALTKHALVEDKKRFAESDIDREKMIGLERAVERSYIIGRVEYKDSLLMVLEDHHYDGSVMRFPITLVQEDGLWKITHKYAADDALFEYLEYEPKLFDGKGQRDDVDKLLRYAQPLQATTTLATGVLSYDLHIYFGPSIKPATFRAELNKRDVSELFVPTPSGDQKVSLTLQTGRNNLTLSVVGQNDKGKDRVDKDNLVFIVE